MWATTYPTLQRGELARINPTLESLSRRKPECLEETIKEVLTDKKTSEKESKHHNKYWQASTYSIVECSLRIFGR